MIYFERLEDNSINQCTEDIELAKRLGFYNEENSTDSWNDFVRYKGKKYLKNEINLEDYLKEEKIIELRLNRQYKCFDVINRGELWYRKLTAEQLEELDKWYHDWLDVTETLLEPETPSWLK